MIQRFMMRYLRKRGWIVFWLDEPAQFCVDRGLRSHLHHEKKDDGCWLWVYLQDKIKAPSPQL